MPRLVAATLVFVSSAAVLVLEILAARLLAPYVGVTHEVYTASIGVILAGIAAGSWWGGRAADRVDPRGLLGPLIVAGGMLSFVTVPIVDTLGAGMRGAGATTTVIVTFATFFAPAAVLTAVTPAVIKIQLSSLAETGRVVGRLSAIGTAGAIVGVFATGFVLIAAWPTRPTIRGLAIGLIVGGAVVWGWLRPRPPQVGVLVLAVATGAFSFAASHPCAFESTYYCAYVTADPGRDDGYVLWLDTLRHSYVDLDDPTYLEFAYTGWFSDVITAIAPKGEPLNALHIGGGALTMPRYLRHAHPGSTSTVLELDELLVELAVDELGFTPGDDVETVTGDARMTIRRLQPARPFDLVIGDAFGGVAVPWHLATRPFAANIRTHMASDGLFVMNVLDHGSKAFLRAQIATVGAVFDHVAVISHPGAFARDGTVGGNHVVVASDTALPIDEIVAANRRRARVDEVLHGPAIDAWTAGAPVLTDDYAPVDQLLTPYPVAPTH